jgi:hypothetical protein
MSGTCAPSSRIRRTRALYAQLLDAGDATGSVVAKFVATGTWRLLSLIALGGPAAGQTGVQIVETQNAAVIRGSAPGNQRIGALIPELEIGAAGARSEELFGAYVHDIADARDGTVWILDDELLPGTSRLRRYDAFGKYLRTAGRVGQGPGEYLELHSIEMLSDGRLLAIDRRLGRVMFHTYSRNGEPTGDVVVQGLHTSALGPPGSARVDALRQAVHIRMTVRMAAADGKLLTYPAVVRVNLAGAVLDTIEAPAVQEPDNPTVSSVSGVRRVTVAAPYTPHAVREWSPLGYWITGVTSEYSISLHRAQVSAGRVQAGGVAVASAAGVGNLRLTRSPTALAVSAEERRDQLRFLEGELTFAGGERTGSLPAIPTVKPPFKAILVADDGRIWVHVSVPSERFAPASVVNRAGRSVFQVPWREPGRYEIFGTQGEYIGAVAVPDDTVLIHIFGDTVWGVTTHADGSKVARRFGVSWNPPP